MNSVISDYALDLGHYALDLEFERIQHEHLLSAVSASDSPARPAESHLSRDAVSQKVSARSHAQFARWKRSAQAHNARRRE